jgi:hypothetical protein
MSKVGSSIEKNRSRSRARRGLMFVSRDAFLHGALPWLLLATTCLLSSMETLDGFASRADSDSLRV